MLILEEFLPYQFSVLSNLMSQGLARTYEERFDLGVSEWRVVAIVGRHAGITATEVADRGALDKVTTSRAVSRLLRSGRLERRNDHPDGRARRLFLSSEGQRIHDTIVPAALAFQQDMLAVLEPAQKQLLADCLERLTAAAGAHLQPPESGSLR